jgi:multidrug efflux system membrane fusion protein
MSRRKIAWIAAAVVAVIVLVVVVRGHRLPKQSPGHGPAPRAGAPGARGKESHEPVPVTAVHVEQRNVPVYLDALGTVQALNTVTVRPQVSGQLLKLEFTEGQEVRKGQVIAQIDPRTFQAQYDQARARKQQDQAQLASARSTLKRYEGLSAKHFVSGQDLENQRNTVAQLKAAVAADAASVRDAQVQLDYTRVRAPVSGLTGIRQIDPGNVVSANSTALVVLTQVHPIYVMFTLPEQNLEEVRAAQARGALPVSALDRTDSHMIAADGTLNVISNQIDTSTGSFQLRAEFPNAKRALWPGQFVNVQMRLRTVHNGLVVPTEAVQRGPDGDYVYVIKADDTVEARPVKVGGEDGDTHVLIDSGLKVGERVVTQGQFRLKPGSKVRPLKPGQVPKPPTAAEIKKAAEQAGRRRSRHH